MSDCKQNCDNKGGDHKGHGQGHDIADIHEANRPGQDQQGDHHEKKGDDHKGQSCGGQKCDDKKDCGKKHEEVQH